jgi:hypothetical protein
MYSSFLLPALVLTLEVAAVAAVAARLSARLVPDPRDLLARCTYGLTLAIAQVIAAVQVAGVLHLLTEAWVSVIQVIIAAACMLWVRPAPRTDLSGHTKRMVNQAVKLVTGVGLTFLTMALFVSLTRASSESDTLSYHLPNVAFWVQQQSLWHLPFSAPTFFTNAYPSNGELTALWLILPLHSDLLAFAMPCVFGVLCVLGTSLLASKLGGTQWVGVLAGLAVATSPLVFGTQVDSMLVDLTAVSGVIVGCVCMLESRDEPSRWCWPALAGLSIGISLGAKDTAVVAAIVTLFVMVVRTPKAYRLRSLAWSLGGTALLSLFWYIRDWVILGNPIFPQSVGIGSHAVFAGPQSPLIRYSTSLLSQFAHLRTGPIHTWLHELAVQYGPALALIALGCIAAVVLAVRRCDWRLGSVALIAWAAVIGYLGTPYTGGGVQGLLFLIASQLRYLLPAAFLAAALAAAVLPRLVTITLCAASIVYGLVKIMELSGRPELKLGVKVVLLSLVVAVFVVVCGPPVIRSARDRLKESHPLWPRLVGLSAMVAVVLFVAAAVMDALPATSQSDPVGQALAAVGQPHGRALLIGSKYAAPYLGPHLENDVYTVGVGGLDDVEAVQRSSTLNEKIVETSAAVLIVTPARFPGEPAGWSPPAGWIKFSSSHGTGIFVRRDQLRATSAAVAPTSHGRS